MKKKMLPDCRKASRPNYAPLGSCTGWQPCSAILPMTVATARRLLHAFKAVGSRRPDLPPSTREAAELDHPLLGQPPASARSACCSTPRVSACVAGRSPSSVSAAAAMPSSVAEEVVPYKFVDEVGAIHTAAGEAESCRCSRRSQSHRCCGAAGVGKAPTLALVPPMPSVWRRRLRRPPQAAAAAAPQQQGRRRQEGPRRRLLLLPPPAAAGRGGGRRRGPAEAGPGLGPSQRGPAEGSARPQQAAAAGPNVQRGCRGQEELA